MDTILQPYNEEYKRIKINIAKDLRRLYNRIILAYQFTRLAPIKKNGMGLDVYLYKGKEEIEMPSKKYPDHYFKIGYFRSSYNDGGINSVLRNLKLPDLYDIFQAGDKYKFKPDWEFAHKKNKEVMDNLKAAPNLRVLECSWNDFIDPRNCKITDKESAMATYLEEKNRQHDGGYSNSNGTFDHNGLKVYGFVQGVRKMLLNDTILPAVYAIYEGENVWYLNALEIVEETIEYVLEQPDINKFQLHWSS